MAILITYPKEKVPKQWQKQLARYDQVIYFPFRLLQPTMLNAEELRAIQTAHDLAITSLFGARIFAKTLCHLNRIARVHVISSKVKHQLLLGGVTNQIEVASTESRRSLLSNLQAVDSSSLCWLVGDHAKKYYRQFPGTTVVTYRNTWDRAHQERAIYLFNHYSFQVVLVTSLSNFERMVKAATVSQYNDYHYFTYFVLGYSTGKNLVDRGLKVIYPQKHTRVLEHALYQLAEYEKIDK